MISVLAWLAGRTGMGTEMRQFAFLAVALMMEFTTMWAG